MQILNDLCLALPPLQPQFSSTPTGPPPTTSHSPTGPTPSHTAALPRQALGSLASQENVRQQVLFKAPGASKGGLAPSPLSSHSLSAHSATKGQLTPPTLGPRSKGVRVHSTHTPPCDVQALGSHHWPGQIVEVDLMHTMQPFSNAWTVVAIPTCLIDARELYEVSHSQPEFSLLEKNGLGTRLLTPLCVQVYGSPEGPLIQTLPIARCSYFSLPIAYCSCFSLPNSSTSRFQYATLLTSQFQLCQFLLPISITDQFQTSSAFLFRACAFNS